MKFWEVLNIKEIISQIPAYKEFMTIEELDESSKKLADEFDSVDLIEIGKSESGHPIYCLKIGEGKKNILFFGFPHPNEPIGSLTVEFLSRYLAENKDFTQNTGYTWHMIKAMDVDGAKLNEGWFKGEFDPVKHSRNFYRPPFHEQIEWSFPIEYKKLKFDTPTQGTKALMKLIDDIKPIFSYSLHNAGFCGVYFYVSKDNKLMCEDFIKLVNDEKLPLHKGEPEMQFNEELYPGIYRSLGVKEAYDFYEADGITISDHIKIGAGSKEYLEEIVGEHCFSLICEMPYVYDKAVGNSELTKFNRRDVVIESITDQKEMFAYVKPIFRKIKKYSDKTTRMYSTVETMIKTYDAELTVSLHHAKTAPSYDRKATVAEVFDSKYNPSFYFLTRFSQLGRLCEEAYAIHQEKKEILELKNELEQWIEIKMNKLMSEINLEIIPIQKLVRVQVGSGLIALKHLSK